MEQHIIRIAKETAIKAARQAGQIAKGRFDQFGQVQVKGQYGDVVTEVDHLTEKIIISQIQSMFPGHQIRSEEIGDNGLQSDWLWLIDPLDGTNNYAISLPIFTTSITLLFKNQPVLGVIYEPLTDRMFVAASGEGANCNQNELRVRECSDLKKGTIGWIQGHGVQKDPKAAQLRFFIDSHFKRMIRLWAPTLQWCLLAKGEIDGMVLYNSEGEDLYSGILMVKEAGGVVVDFNGRPFESVVDEPYLIACHPAHQEELVQLVNEGLD